MIRLAAPPVDRPVLERLVRPHAHPAVTLVIPFDHRRPGNREDPRRIAAMRANVFASLDGTGAPGADAVAERLDDAIARVDLEHPVPGLVILVAPDTTAVLHLGSTPRTSVTIARQFALAAVLSALQHEVRARALLLGRAESRCIEVDDGTASERTDHGFPVDAVVRGSVGNPHEDRPAGERVVAEDALATFRTVWANLVALQRDAPREVVLVGTDRDLAFVDAVRGEEVPVAARVAASHEWDRPDEVAALVRPVLQAEHAAAMGELCRAAQEALGHGVVAGVAPVWRAARTGRGHRLLVEDDLRYPTRPQANDELGPLDLDAAADPEHLDGVDDAIAATLARDGEVIVVPAGALAGLDGIALVTRY